MDRQRQRKLVRLLAAALLGTVTVALVVSASRVYDNELLSLLKPSRSYDLAANLFRKKPKYKVSVGKIGPWGYPDDTPALGFFDKDGAYHLQQSDGEYAPDAPRWWSFFSGKDIDSATLDKDITYYVNPANGDSNGNTTWRCNNSPTGKRATYTPREGSHYSQRNYCDLIGLWVDPDTGDWHGVVHNEFSPEPFGDWLHFDALDRAISKDGGRTWDITETILSSPYSTERGDDGAFPEQTYYWGAGDPRLIVDIASGYFYMGYGSRVVDKNGTWIAFNSHFARAPISDKLKAGSWQKWHRGAWSEPGLGGKESPVVPVDDEHPDGYSTLEYDPHTPGKAQEQINAGKLEPTSALFWMDVGWNAHLGLWIGEPTHPDRATTEDKLPQQFYGTEDLTTMRWRLLGDTGKKYRSRSAYRWMIDAKTRTTGAILGKHFRAYCSFGCAESDAEYVNVAIDSEHKNKPLNTKTKYTVKTADGRHIGHLKGKIKFSPIGDGSYNIATKEGILGIEEKASMRAWGRQPKLLGAKHADSAGAQWWIIPSRSHEDNSLTGEFRLVNRYSGLVLSTDGLVPARSWAHGDQKPESQELVLTKV